jgi:hypothetical protein
MPHKITRNGLLLVVMLLLLISTNGMAVILHPDSEPAADFSDISIPDPNVVGKWWRSNSLGFYASCVAVAPNYVIATTHQGIDIDPNGIITSKVKIGDVTYSIDRYWNHPNQVNPSDPAYYRVDLRLVKLRAANLKNYVEIFSDSNEIDIIPDAVIGGYGVGRGPKIFKTVGQEDITYGYQWNDIMVQRWGTNRIDDATNDLIVPNSNYNMNFLFMDFDPPGETPFEAALGDHDSGCGWFLWHGNKWKVAALTFGVSRFGESHFLTDSTKPSEKYDPNPDQLYGIRLSSYRDWIVSHIPNACSEIMQNDLDGNCVVDQGDLIEFASHWLRTDCGPENNYCQGADLDRINGVNLADFAILAADWLRDLTIP